MSIVCLEKNGTRRFLLRPMRSKERRSKEFDYATDKVLVAFWAVRVESSDWRP